MGGQGVVAGRVRVYCLAFCSMNPAFFLVAFCAGIHYTMTQDTRYMMHPGKRGDPPCPTPNHPAKPITHMSKLPTSVMSGIT
ncbi:MAG: hypothetical protein MJE68_24635 [Proteobacteria bacterium]|nr:hypothetical protein [Pseudomonadota bacterium]